MTDPIRDLQSKLRSSQDPISTFYLIETRTGAERMLEKVRLLAGKGVAEGDIASIAQLVTDVLRQGDHNAPPGREASTAARPTDAGTLMATVSPAVPAAAHPTPSIAKDVGVGLALPYSVEDGGVSAEGPRANGDEAEGRLRPARPALRRAAPSADRARSWFCVVPSPRRGEMRRRGGWEEEREEEGGRGNLRLDGSASRPSPHIAGITRKQGEQRSHGVRDARQVGYGACGTQVLAVRLDDKAAGNVTATHRLWQTRLPKECVGSPVITAGHAYVVTQFGSIVCLDLKDGNKLAEKRLTGQGALSGSWSSPVLAGGKLFVPNQSGEVFIVKPTPELEILGINPAGDEATCASPAISDGQIFLRTYKALWCIGGKG
jgi:hypothetical protein